MDKNPNQWKLKKERIFPRPSSKSERIPQNRGRQADLYEMIFVRILQQVLHKSTQSFSKWWKKFDLFVQNCQEGVSNLFFFLG
jgi:hypothetical protein